MRARTPRLASIITPTHNRPIQTRPFSLPTPFSLTSPPLRHLTHTQTLPYPAPLLFSAVASIDLYPSFLPFTLASTVLARDPATALPSRARLTVGYPPFGLQEDWESIVECDAERGVVEARSAEEGNEEGLFEVLRTRWEILPHAKDGREAQAKLDLHVKFRSAVYDQMFAAVEGRVAGAVIMAFERRVKELAEVQRGKEKEKEKEGAVGFNSYGKYEEVRSRDREGVGKR